MLFFQKQLEINSILITLYVLDLIYLSIIGCLTPYWFEDIRFEAYFV